MREILFRGKRVDNGEWTEGYLFKQWNRTFLLWGVTGDIPNMTEVISETAGQFTGLTDKNGNKIFEGDICKVTYLDRRCNSNGKHYLAENEMIEKVVFKNGAFCFKVIIEDIAMYRPIGFDIYEKQKIKYVEVSGNIYDNPELLEVEE